MKAKPYAYVCTLCHHLASRHGLKAGAVSVVDGPYLCAEDGCGCEIDQRTPLSGIDRVTCEARFGR